MVPQPIERGEECHLCGMIIAELPGPKGQVLVRGHSRALNFCSTQDLFAWLLQPENAVLARDVYVHDMGATDWERPSDDAFTDARSAWYVWGHPKPGAMGHALASFKQRQEAHAFAKGFGGTVYPYDEISLELITGAGAGHYQRKGIGEP